MASESNTKTDQPDHKTMEVLYDFLKNAPERQIDSAVALDTKMVQIFSAASVVIGLAGFSSRALAQTDWAVTMLLLLGLASYAVTAYIVFNQLRPQVYRRSLNANEWWRLLWNRSESEARHSILSDVAKSYAHNQPILAGKAQSIHLALATTAIEVVLVGLALIAAQTG